MASKVINIFDVGDYERHTVEAAHLLSSGGVVVLPTETVYGFAGLLSAGPTLARLRAFKSASSTGPTPLTIHLGQRDAAARLLGELPELPTRLIRKLWPGPVGLIFKVAAEHRARAAREVGVPESELYDAAGLITLRCPDHPIARDVISATAGFVVVTQAPTDNKTPAHRISDISDDALGSADLVLSAGPSRFSKPSTLLRVHSDHYDVVRPGVYDDRILQRMLKTTLLFVCSGNTCRSPMAMALARKILCEKLRVTEDELDNRGIAVLSAGTFAMPGSRATPQAVDAVKDLGADLSKHRSRPLTPELIHQADVIYTMGRSHKSAVLALAPGAAGKTFTLAQNADIEDPIGSDVSVYRALAQSMGPLIEQRLSERPLN